MSFILEANKYKPVGLFNMDDTTPLQDYSPYANAASYTGSPARHPALVHGATYAPILTNSAVAQFTCPVFVQGREKNSFSIGATVSVVTNGASAPIQILGHTGQYDGLTIDGTKVSFSTKYLTAGEAKCTFELQTLRSINVVGVHTYSKNLLYVDGEVVAEVNITNAQKADSFISTDGKLYSGQTTSTRGIAVNGVFYFDYALPQTSITNMHNEARRVPSSNHITPMFGGERLAMGKNSSDIFATQSWKTTTDWNTGQHSGTSVRDGQLVPQFSAGVSLASKWYTTFVLSSAGTTSIYGVNLDWDGEGMTVDVSLDATTWVSVTRGVNVSNISPGFNPTGKELLIRVSFPGGITEDTSYLNEIKVIGTRTSVSSTWSGRTLTFVSAYQQKDVEAITFDSLWGAKIASGGTITITPDTSPQATVARTIELWVRADAAGVSVNVTGTYYQNGVAATSTLSVGPWTLYHIVAAANVTTNIVISGSAQIGHLSLYPTALSSTVIAEISAAYAGSNILTASDSSPVVVSESATAAQIYAYNWSILSSG